MSTQKLYDQWSTTYDAVENKTRDLEKFVCERVLSKVLFDTVIELGSGTGKNTAWLADRAKSVFSVDLSEEMQAIAKAKVINSNVEFRQADIKKEWVFAGPDFDLITCSLILEHIQNLDHVFRQASKNLVHGGHFYICELHPFKQYVGSKARFESHDGLQVLECFRHHVTDYTDAAVNNGFAIERLDEWFDDDDRNQIPRLISFLFVNNL
jgi:ubiquinone/menaquinone biosynthesis C-methylase UbiE